MFRNILARSSQNPLLKVLKSLRKNRHSLQKFKTSHGLPLKHLGTEYGGWTFVDDKRLFNSTIISAGLGEDASFDVEFAKEYKANVIIVDPTPRAISHFKSIKANIGRSKSRGYVKGGNQPIEAYPLDEIQQNQLTLVEKALWNQNEKLKFFAPRNPQYVSHSIVNFQNDYSQSTDHIEVDAITIKELISQLSLRDKTIPLVKLDIEGAEIEVIEHMISCKFTPCQICVEYDEFNVPTEKGVKRIEKCHALLNEAGYELVRTNGKADFLYVRK